MISSDEEGKEEKKVSQEPEPKHNFAAELNNKMMFEHRLIEKFSFDFLNLKCKLYLTSDCKRLVVDDPLCKIVHIIDLETLK